MGGKGPQSLWLMLCFQRVVAKRAGSQLQGDIGAPASLGKEIGVRFRV